MILFNLSSIINDPIGFLKQLLCLLPIMLISLTLHEWGHAFAAHLCGDDTARNMGRMTLNPLKHIDPLGFLAILIAGFGWAKPVPVNSRNFRNYKRGEAIVSLAGVFMNLLLVILFSALFVVTEYYWIKTGKEWLSNEYLWMIIEFGIILNLTLMLFNLLPIFPLDGYHIFELLFGRILPFKVLLFLRRYGQFILIGLFIMMRVLNFYPVYDLAMWWIGKLTKLVLLLL